jgi:RNA polymerase sigma-70 factor (ECF subfamily)
VNPFNNWPNPEEESLLLTHLSSGVPAAKEEIAARYLPLLTHYLRCAFPREAEDVRDTAADTALLNFLDVPERFDPARGGLGKYLRVSARCDLLNLLEHEARARWGIPLDSVAELADGRNVSPDGELTWDHPRLAAECASFNTEERITFELMREGVRDTPAFAVGLGLTHLAAAEQAVAVKRFKDRVKKRLARAVEDLR